MPENQANMQNNDEDFVPVYLFLGFLEAGKTKFVQEALEDPRFSKGERTLLIICEEGENEYDLSKVPGGNVFAYTVEDALDLNPEKLQSLLKQYNAERVIIEYNGMWQVNDLFDNMPDDWAIYQAVMIADATTFLNYNANMRSLVVDKLNVSEMVYFNRFTKQMNMQELHQVVRGVSRRMEIYYEFPDGNTVFDDIEDPLPFDVNAKQITIEDSDFALFFRDLMDDPQKYSGKTVTFKGLAVKNPTFPPNIFAIGRHIMTCCVEDIQYCWIGAQYDKKFVPHKDHWITVTGKIVMQFNRAQNTSIPMLNVREITDAEPPAQPVATFY